MDIKEIFSVSLILFSVIDIIGSVPFIILIKKREGRIYAEKATLISAVLMVGFLYLGLSILKLFGLDVASFAVAGDLADGRLVQVGATAGLKADGLWCAMTLPPQGMAPAAAELVRFITTPRAIQAMLRGSGVNISHFRPSVHVTLWN